MSAALVRQALEFVDPDESVGKRSKRRKRQPNRPGASGQDSAPYQRKVKKAEIKGKDTTEENIKKLLALSAPTVNEDISQKIVKRAIKGKPLIENIEVKKEEEKSILFPNESFKDFENELFCS